MFTLTLSGEHKKGDIPPQQKKNLIQGLARTVKVAIARELDLDGVSVPDKLFGYGGNVLGIFKNKASFFLGFPVTPIEIPV
jgi:hypothetical protein